MNKLDHALHLASLGYHVFPVMENAKYPPAFKDFPSKATNDEKQITDWWTNGYSNFNIGISTTKFKESEALIVVDVDTKEGKMGELELLKLELEGMDFPTTAEQVSANGGRHLIYTTTEATRQPDLSPSINIRSKGGYILGQGSTVDGKEYKLGVIKKPSSAPQSLISRCGRIIEKNLKSTPTNISSAKERINHYLQYEAPIAEEGHGGDQTTFIVAAKCKDFGASEQETFDLMSELWNPSCIPEWSGDQLKSKVANAYKYGSNPLGASAPESDFQPILEKAVRDKNSLFGEEFLEVNPDFNQTYLIENLLAPTAMSVVYGESNSGKTFFCLDMALHVALGQDWHSRKVNKGLVFYVASEGGWGIKKRIKAFRQYHNLEGKQVPFVLIPCPINLLDPKVHVNELISLIAKYEQKYLLKASLVVIDTLARAMGSGNENAPSDMGAFVKNVDYIRAGTNAHLMIIHHSGKDVAKGARGHSSLRAATDTEIEINQFAATTKKQRDQDFGKPIGFKLQQIEIGKNKAGDPVNSCVVLPANISATQDFSKAKLDPESLAGKGFLAIQKVLDWSPQPAPNDLDMADDATVANIDDWRSEFFHLCYGEVEVTKAMHRAFKRVTEQLIQLGYIEMNDNFSWLSTVHCP